MKKLFKQLSKINQELQDVIREAGQLRSLPYYKAFGRESELNADMRVLENRRDELVAMKLAVLNQIEDAAGVEILKLKNATNAEAA